MKRLICFLLVLLLLAGCAGNQQPAETTAAPTEATVAPTETTDAPTEPAIPWIDTAGTPWDIEGALRELTLEIPDGMSYTNAMEFDGDMLFWRLDSQQPKVVTLEMCLVELDDGSVRATREQDFIGFNIPQTIGGVLYLCDSGSGTVIALDSNLEEKERYTFPVCEGIFCTGSNEMLYVYDWEGSAKAIDLNSGAESVLLDGLYIENFYAEDQYLFLEYIDPDIGIKKTAVLDLASGLFHEPPVSGRYEDLSYAQGTWLCQNYGEVNTVYVGTGVDDFRMATIPMNTLELLDGNHLVMTDGESNGVYLYDTQGGLISQVTLAAEPYRYSCLELIPSDAFGGYFMVISDYFGDCRLLYWDAKPAQQGDDLNFSPVPQPGEQESAVLKKAEDLSRRYGVNILVGENCETVFFDFTVQQMTDWQEVSQALDVLAGVLEVYPEGFFRQLRYNNIRSIEINLTGTITPTTAEYTDIYEAFVQEDYDKQVMVVDIGICRRATYYHEFSHIIDAFLSWDASVREGALFSEETWNSLNPDWFQGYSFDYSNQQTLQDYTSFIDNYSTIRPTEDRARVLEYSMEEYCDGFYADGTVLQAKLSYYCRCIRDAFDTTDWPDTVIWEQYLP